MISLKSARSHAARALKDIGIGLSALLGFALAIAVVMGALYALIAGPTWARLAVGIPIVLALLAAAGRNYRSGGF